MNTSRNREVTVFSASLAFDRGERSAYLDHACAGDPALRLQVEALLSAHDKAITFLESPLRCFVPTPRAPPGRFASEKPGYHIGVTSSSSNLTTGQPTFGL